MLTFPEKFDVIVVGAGHAGIEASLAAAKLGVKVLVVTLSFDRIGWMSCNPSIGGIAKGHLVKEIDALGGRMGMVADETAIQFRILNKTKGPAVQSTRVQSDMRLYSEKMRQALEGEGRITIKEDRVTGIAVKNGSVEGIYTAYGFFYPGKTVVLTTGTFLKGLLHIGLSSSAGGRLGDPPSNELSESLKEFGFELLRLKTGTPARLDGRTINFDLLEEQRGDENIRGFSFFKKFKPLPQRACFITHTNEKTHEIIRKNLDRSPLFSGVITGVGPRYCPSIEDKVVKFQDRDRHQIFLEPTGLNTVEYYPNGISTSLPIDVQIDLIHSIKGLEKAHFIKPGYAVEYDAINPTQLYYTLESKIVKNLFFAGQINGTSGYEEAAAQGIIAGINAALKIRGDEPFILDRSEAYIGVMIDDLVTKGVDEPYRLFTSRAEYRLLLREDNADLRLTEKARRIGMISDEFYTIFKKRKKKIDELFKVLKENKIRPDKKTVELLKTVGISEPKKPVTLEELLRRQEVSIEKLKTLFPSAFNDFPQDVCEHVEIEVKYGGYIKRQREQVLMFRKIESVKIPENLPIDEIPGLSNEIVEKIKKVSPENLGQLSRISGVTPASVQAIMIYLKKMKGREHE